MKTLFIINPTSGRKKFRDTLEELIERVYPRTGNPFTIHRCERKHDLDDVIGEGLANHFELIFAVGGDGTVHEIGTRLIGKEVVLGILPTGSGNGLARHLRIPLNPEEALRAVPQGRVESIDTAAVNGIPFINVAGVGFDAEVASRFASSTTRGLETYVREGLMIYSSYANEDYEIVMNGTHLHETAFLIAVANASQYGNDARIAPEASLRDGLLDLSILREGSLLAAPMLLQQLFSGRLHQSAHVKTHKAREITIRRTIPGPAHVDGEPHILPETLHFTINPLSLRVLVPANAKL